MYNREKRLRTTNYRSRLKEDTSVKVFDPQKHKKDMKNNLRAKAEKKKQEKLARQVKKIHVSFACFCQETKKLCIALVDCEIRIYNVKENGKRIKLEDKPLSFRAKNIVTYMEITKFVVNDRQILILGTDVGTIEIYYLDERSTKIDKNHQKLMKIENFEGFQINRKRDMKLQSTLMKNFPIEKNKELQVIKLKYARDVGLIV